MSAILILGLSYCHLLNEMKKTIIYKDLEESRVAKAVGLVPASSQCPPVLEVQVLGGHGHTDEEVAAGDQIFQACCQSRHISSQTVWMAKAMKLNTNNTVGQAFLAVTEVVFEVVSVVLEFVEGFVFDFPSASCAIDQLPDVVSRDRDEGDEMALVGFASGAMDLQCCPTRSSINRPAGETTSILQAFAVASSVPRQARRRTTPAKSRSDSGECGCRTESEPS